MYDYLLGYVQQVYGQKAILIVNTSAWCIVNNDVTLDIPIEEYSTKTINSLSIDIILSNAQFEERNESFREF